MHIRWRMLELPSVVDCDKASLSDTYGKFTAEPFERGFGVTIGNSLRRILLSSLIGSAVTQVKIEGAQHEFTSIPGVVEDVTDILLNLFAYDAAVFDPRLVTNWVILALLVVLAKWLAKRKARPHSNLLQSARTRKGSV